jgi:hypothetical protein
MDTLLPSTQTALKIRGANDIALEEGLPLPELQPDDILVQVAAVSVNHVCEATHCGKTRC